MSREVDALIFGERVERLCDFFLNQIPRDGSDTIKILDELKADAQALQDQTRKELSFQGLDAYMRGLPIKET